MQLAGGSKVGALRAEYQREEQHALVGGPHAGSIPRGQSDEAAVASVMVTALCSLTERGRLMINHAFLPSTPSSGAAAPEASFLTAHPLNRQRRQAAQSDVSTISGADPVPTCMPSADMRAVSRQQMRLHEL